jgi:uncharacterized integral membrane protein
MWIVRWIIGALMVIVAIGFAMQNTDISVSVRFLKWQSLDLPLWLVMYASFVVGIIFWLVVSIFQILVFKNSLRKKQKEVRILKEELDRLRNVSVEDVETVPEPAQKPAKE